MLVAATAVVRGEVKDLVASDAVPGLLVPPGAAARVVADFKNEGVTSPTAISQDAQGRWYVAETLRFRHGVEDNRNCLFWLADDLASQTTEDRAAMIEKWSGKFTEGYFTDKTERIRVLADPDEEGRFKTSGIFAEGFNQPLDGTAAGVFAYDDVVYFACIPSITALANTDGDLKADQRSTLQDGFGVKVSFSGHDLNGFELGPDGRIWGTIGDRGFAITTREGKRFEFPDQGAVFRFDPDGSNFEVVHQGLRNPKELAFDRHGNPVTVDNNADQGDRARVVYVVPGGDSGWRMGHQTLMSFGEHVGSVRGAPSAWMTEKRWELENEDQPAFMVPPIAHLSSGPSGLAYHPGTGFLESEENRFVVCDYRASPATSGLWSFELQESGASMTMKNPRELVWGITATDVSYSWEGSLMVADFQGGWTTHDDGRLVEITSAERFRPKEADEVAKAIREGLEDVDVEQLAKWLGHADMRLRIRAQLELTRRKEGPSILLKTAVSGQGVERLHGIWGLGVFLRRGPAAEATAEDDGFSAIPGSTGRRGLLPALSELMRDPDPEIRVQTAKVIGEMGGAGDSPGFGPLILDENPRVQFYGTIAAGQSQAVGCMSFIWEMLEKKGASDPYLRHAGAYALARLCSSRQLAGLASNPHVGLRLAVVNALAQKADPRLVDFLSDADARVMKEVVRLVHDGNMEQLRGALMDRALQGLSYNLDETTLRRFIHNALHLGGEKSLKWVASLPMERGIPKALRLEAVRVLLMWDHPPEIDGATGRYLPPVMEGRAKLQDTLNPMVDDLSRVDPVILGASLDMIRKLKLDASVISDVRLGEIITDQELPAPARVAALDLLLERGADQQVELLTGLAEGSNDELAMSSLSRLATLSPDKVVEGLSKNTDSPVAKRRQLAWEIAGRIQSPEADRLLVAGLERLVEKKGEDAAGLELVKAAEGSESPEVKAGLEAYREAMAAAGDPLADWKICLEGGDAEKGSEIFLSHGTAQCAKCHQTGGDHGSEAGPNLQGLAARGDRRYFLESLIVPQATVAPGFGLVTAMLNDGQVVAGALVSETDDSVEIDVAGETKSIPRGDIKTLGEPLSIMPPMGSILNREEVRDLVAWLATMEPESDKE